MNNIVSTGWYQSMIEDCRAIKTEAEFNSAWELIAGYHAVGRRIVEEVNLDRKAIYGKKILQGIAESIRMSERTLYYAIQFYETIPDLDKLPDGKNVSWYRITKMLGKPKDTKATRWQWHWTRVISNLDALQSFDGQVPGDVAAWVRDGVRLREKYGKG